MTMKAGTPIRIAPWWMLALTLIVAAGCSRRAAETPPVTPPTPPVTRDTTTTPPTPPTDTGADTPTPGIGSSDFRPAFFAYDSYSLDDAARAALDHDARLLRENASVRVIIEGHADERGTNEYNQALGEQRARAARDYLAAAGIAQNRMEIVSYGEERPFASGSDESSWQQNRRAHFAVR
jgi:peptidoglycan-associated lipoprotein